MIEDIDHENAERLTALLQIVAAADEEPLPIDTLDGYMTALVCGPVTSSPLQAMDGLFGDDWAAALDAQDATEEFMDRLHLRWNEIAATLDPAALLADQEQMQLMPLITEFDESMKADLLAQGVLTAAQLDSLPGAGVMWVDGFMRAVHEHEAAWYVNEADSEQGQMLDAMLMALAAVAMPQGEQRDAYIAESYEAEDTVDQNVLLDDALFSVQDLRLFWLQPSASDDAVH
ncbi:UPF0149 family protein [Paucibacter sp. R3-3]|uniref:UPF0149 family protein n=1 Tax=Roseateles agri TaxID=3098619 RepID=A0ABU5DS19_9BURK|nr:UPF0149 family protein [Paucibacter sp. R3-3]MDY0749121.1 UPF0149 family protein [Paucibacter sp. R3-3]